MEYIIHEENIYVNKVRGDALASNSFLVRIVEENNKWHEVRERDVIVFSRYLDGYRMSGFLKEFKEYKIKKKKFKGLE